MDPFAIHLRTARGFLDLGLPHDAWNELEAIEPPGRRAEPAVLALRLCILLDLQRWPLAVEVARHLATVEPQEAGWPLALARALRHTEGVAAARAVLERAAPRFPTVAAYPYALACLAAQGGEMALARDHLEWAFALDPGLRLESFSEADLRSFWSELGRVPGEGGA